MINTTVGGDFDSTGGKLQASGWFHLLVEDCQSPVTKNDGTPVTNAMFKLNCLVLAGTAPDCRNQRVDITVWLPRLQNKDGGAFDQKKIDRMLIALSIIRGDESDKGKEVSFEASDLKGRQLITEFEIPSGESWPRVKAANTFHVDDPIVAKQPKDTGMLSIIPPAQRRTEDAPATTAPRPAAGAPGAAGVPNVNDLDI